VEVRKLAFPAYTAVRLRTPTGNVAEVNVAMPEPFRLALPRVVVPFKKVTVPAAGPTPGAATETVAVNVTVCPVVAGFGDAVRAVVVLAAPRLKLIAGEEFEGANPALPAYEAIKL
jgi:hypothetical protein